MTDYETYANDLKTRDLASMRHDRMIDSRSLYMEKYIPE